MLIQLRLDQWLQKFIVRPRIIVPSRGWRTLLCIINKFVLLCEATLTLNWNYYSWSLEQTVKRSIQCSSKGTALICTYFACEKNSNCSYRLKNLLFTYFQAKGEELTFESEAGEDKNCHILLGSFDNNKTMNEAARNKV